MTDTSRARVATGNVGFGVERWESLDIPRLTLAQIKECTYKTILVDNFSGDGDSMYKALCLAEELVERQLENAVAEKRLPEARRLLRLKAEVSMACYIIAMLLELSPREIACFVDRVRDDELSDMADA